MIRFPFTSLQQLNLDWVMEQLHKILQFMPLNGVPGDVLQRNADGAAWMPIAAISLDIHSMDALTDPVAGNDELPIYDNSAQGNFKTTVNDLMEQAPVQSVNGQTGDVVLSIPSIPVDSVNGQTGTVVLDASDVGALPDSYTAPVSSVNGQTGAVSLSIPTDTSDLTNTAGFVDAAGAAAAAPVQSVNGQTGAVTVSAGGFSIDELWTNSSPTSSFAAQTIPLDLTGYSAIIIECALTTNAAQPVTCPIFPLDITRNGRICCYNNSFLYRDITITGSGVTFTSGKQASTYMATPDDANASIIPLRILGIA